MTRHHEPRRQCLPSHRTSSSGSADDAFEDEHADQIGDAIVYLWGNSDFPDHAEGHVDGYYRVERPRSDVALNLRASYYNRWRDELCRMCTGRPIEEVWKHEVVSEAFMALLDFGDNEGLIGPERCRQLAADFNARAAEAKRYATKLSEREDADVGNTWREVYEGWQRVFNAAVPLGVVQFH